MLSLRPSKTPALGALATLFWSLWVLHAHGTLKCMQINIHTHEINKNKQNLKMRKTIREFLRYENPNDVFASELEECMSSEVLN